MHVNVFTPHVLGTAIIPNAAAASTPVLIGDGNSVFALYNSSTTATAFVEITTTPNNTDAGRNAVIPTGTAANQRGSFPVPPLSLIRIRPGYGRYHWVSVIASAADGSTYVTPGDGF